MKLGFIGAGNMAGALIHGVVTQGVLPAAQVHIFDISEACMRAHSEALGVVPHADCSEMIEACDMVVFAVKPNVLPGVLAAQRAALAGKAVISIVAGFTVAMLRAKLHPDTRLLRVMPNTPALCGAGMTCFSLEHTLTEAEKTFAEKMFSALGRLLWVHEYQMNAVIGLSGSGPAYAYLFIEAMADGGVACGLTRSDALQMAAQTLLGSAQMVLDTGKHPGALKDAVCSPGGTTIDAVRELESHGFRAAVIEAVVRAHDKAAAMSKDA